MVSFSGEFKHNWGSQKSCFPKLKFGEFEIATILGRNFNRNAETRWIFKRVDKGHFGEGLLFWQATKASIFSKHASCRHRELSSLLDLKGTSKYTADGRIWALGSKSQIVPPTIFWSNSTSICCFARSLWQYAKSSATWSHCRFVTLKLQSGHCCQAGLITLDSGWTGIPTWCLATVLLNQLTSA